ncbi:MAG: hypothetical protein AAGD01_06345 [Acidobacteriota bacterium]
MATLIWLAAAFVLVLYGRPLGARIARALQRPRPDHAPKIPFSLDLALAFTGALVGGLIATFLGFGGLVAFDWRALVVSNLCAALAMVLGRGVGEGKRP